MDLTYLPFRERCIFRAGQARGQAKMAVSSARYWRDVRDDVKRADFYAKMALRCTRECIGQLKLSRPVVETPHKFITMFVERAS